MKTICLAAIAFAVNAVELSTSGGKSSSQDRLVIVRQSASKAFAEWDTDNSKSLDIYEMREYYNEGDVRDVDDFEDFMKQVDIDQNGTIDAFEFYEEFVIKKDSYLNDN